MITIEGLQAEVERLKIAIRTHRDQRGDDRCWLDDLQLYAILGETAKADNRVGDKAAMIVNCARFIEQRCESGGWPSYAELEAELQKAKAEIAMLQKRLELASLALDKAQGKVQDLFDCMPPVRMTPAPLPEPPQDAGGGPVKPNS